jgi:hypothetical protein
MPRPRYVVTLEDHLHVRDLASFGMSEADIANQLKLPLETVNRIFKRALQTGGATGREQALRQLYDLAVSGKNLPALLFWIKARCGWRDTGKPDEQPTKFVRSVMVFRPSSPGGWDIKETEGYL